MLQVYVGRDTGGERPRRELKAFVKAQLAAGESRDVELELTARDFAGFDVAGQRWQVEAGAYEIAAGFSAAEIVGRAAVTLAAVTLPR